MIFHALLRTVTWLFALALPFLTALQLQGAGGEMVGGHSGPDRHAHHPVGEPHHHGDADDQHESPDSPCHHHDDHCCHTPCSDGPAGLVESARPAVPLDGVEAPSLRQTALLPILTSEFFHPPIA
ncbi:MAG: hypothetical protein HYY93_10395 [Planctomycetes bacterium]|nr:hypothetical protein [Planctomycetota bacterium]